MEEGTIVHVDYELYNGETGELIETTREEVAKDYVTKSELTISIDRVIDRLDKLDEKMDKLITG